VAAPESRPPSEGACCKSKSRFASLALFSAVAAVWAPTVRADIYSVSTSFQTVTINGGTGTYIDPNASNTNTTFAVSFLNKHGDGPDDPPSGSYTYQNDNLYYTSIGANTALGNQNNLSGVHTIHAATINFNTNRGPHDIVGSESFSASSTKSMNDPVSVGIICTVTDGGMSGDFMLGGDLTGTVTNNGTTVPSENLAFSSIHSGLYTTGPSTLMINGTLFTVMIVGNGLTAPDANGNSYLDVLVTPTTIAAAVPEPSTWLLSGMTLLFGGAVSVFKRARDRRAA
jgi:hypothetical protein